MVATLLIWLWQCLIPMLWWAKTPSKLQNTLFFHTRHGVRTYSTLFQLRSFYLNKTSHVTKVRAEGSYEDSGGQVFVSLFHFSLCFSLLLNSLVPLLSASLSLGRRFKRAVFSLRWCGPPLSVLTLQRNAWHSPGCAYTRLLRWVKKGGEGERERRKAKAKGKWVL